MIDRDDEINEFGEFPEQRIRNMNDHDLIIHLVTLHYSICRDIKKVCDAQCATAGVVSGHTIDIALLQKSVADTHAENLVVSGKVVLVEDKVKDVCDSIKGYQNRFLGAKYSWKVMSAVLVVGYVILDELCRTFWWLVWPK